MASYPPQRQPTANAMSGQQPQQQGTRSRLPPQRVGSNTEHWAYAQQQQAAQARGSGVQAGGYPAQQPQYGQQPQQPQRPTQQAPGVGMQQHAQQHQKLATPKDRLDKLAKVYGQTVSIYDQSAFQSRLILSLRTFSVTDVDWSLERLMKASVEQPDLLRFADLVGLLDSLVGLIAHHSEPASVSSSSSAATAGPSTSSYLDQLWPSPARIQARRWATEAALVLRNLALEQVNSKPLCQQKRLPFVILGVLEHERKKEGQMQIDGAEEAGNELSLYLLEVLEVIAPHLVLSLPSTTPAPGAPAAPKQKPSQRLSALFVELALLTRSRDRALLIGAFRCLAALAGNNASDAVFALPSYGLLFSSFLDGEDEAAGAPSQHPIETALTLLGLADHDLTLAVLDYLYTFTSLPVNAVAVAARPDLVHIFRIVATKLPVLATKETLKIDVPMKNSESETWYRGQAPRHRARLNWTPPVDTSTGYNLKLEPELQRDLIVLPEPRRTLTWMRMVFEADPEGEVTQVALWTAYRSEFDNPGVSAQMPTDPRCALLTAGDVIKRASEAFPHALPTVVEGAEKRFIIKGMRIRDRTNMKEVFKCKWKGCMVIAGPDSLDALYSHVHHEHLAAAAAGFTPNKCMWQHCGYTPSFENETDPELRAKDLLVHVRSHLPRHHSLPPQAAASTASKIDAQTGIMADQKLTAEHIRFHAMQDEAGEITGVAFLGCLVIRNIAKAIQGALGAAAGPKGVAALSGGEPSIFEYLQKAKEEAKKAKNDKAEDAPVDTSTVMDFEKVDYAPAKQGADALLAVENDLLRVTVESHLLGKMLGVVLVVAVVARNAKRPQQPAATSVNGR